MDPVTTPQISYLPPTTISEAMREANRWLQNCRREQNPRDLANARQMLELAMRLEETPDYTWQGSRATYAWMLIRHYPAERDQGIALIKENIEESKDGNTALQLVNELTQREGYAPDYVQAREVLEMVADVNQSCHTQLVLLLLKKCGDTPAALARLKAKIEAGGRECEWSACQYATIFYEGHYGVEVDHEQAEWALQKAMDSGAYLKDQFRRMYANMRYAKGDMAKGVYMGYESTGREQYRQHVRSFHQLDDRGSEAAISQLSNNLARLLVTTDDEDVKRDIHRDLGRIALRINQRKSTHSGRYKKAVFNWQKGAELGDAASKHFLAIAYQTGRGVKRDLDKAARLEAEAVEAGYQATAHADDLAFDQLTSLDALQLRDIENEDLAASKLKFSNRVKHTLHRNMPLIKRILKIAAISFAVAVAAAAAVTGIVFATIAAPHVMIPILGGLGALVAMFGVMAFTMAASPEPDHSRPMRYIPPRDRWGHRGNYGYGIL